jgi:hypothetical protein
VVTSENDLRKRARRTPPIFDHLAFLALGTQLRTMTVLLDERLALVVDR